MKAVFLENASSLEIDLNEVSSTDRRGCYRYQVRSELISTYPLLHPFLLQPFNVELTICADQIPDHVPLSQLAVQGQAYLHVETPEREQLFGRITKNFPLQFGREVLADSRHFHEHRWPGLDPAAISLSLGNRAAISLFLGKGQPEMFYDRC